MGWLDKATAAAKVAANAAREAAQEMAADMEAEHGDKPEYQEFQQSWTRLKEKAKAGAVEAKALRNEAIAEFGGTESGRAVGEATRGLGTVLSRMPVLSALSDAAQSRHGVGKLRDQFMAEPGDPVLALWLAESMRRVGEDMHRYRVVRSVTSPTYAIMNQSIRAAGEVGKTDSDPVERKLLKVAFVRSRERVREHPEDAESLHVLARVYLAQGQAEQAGRFAKLALLSNPAQPLPWITLSRAYLEVGQSENARKAAQRAVDEGAGYGNEMLARLVLAGGAKSKDDIQHYEAYRAAVTPQDKTAYLGVAVSGSDWWEDLKDRQSGKTVKLLDELEMTNA